MLESWIVSPVLYRMCHDYASLADTTGVGLHTCSSHVGVLGSVALSACHTHLLRHVGVHGRGTCAWGVGTRHTRGVKSCRRLSTRG
jgi:hypothetical protein